MTKYIKLLITPHPDPLPQRGEDKGEGETKGEKNMPKDITDEEVGMRSFQLRKGRAVERAIEKIRQNLGTHWIKLSLHDIEMLQWVLGEVWAFIARANWDNLAFSSTTLEETKKIIQIGNEIINHERIGSTGLDEVYKIIKKIQT